MKNKQSVALRIVVLITLIATLTVLSSRMKADTGTCGGATTTLPFTDVMGNGFFCQIASAYFSGLTNGTSATTYTPGAIVTREQMAAFITRTMDQSLKRGSDRATGEKWFTPQTANSLTLTDVGNTPQLVEYDGTDVWIANQVSGSVMRIRPGDGKLLDTWTGVTAATGIVAAMGRIFITGQTNPGRLYMIDPTQPGAALVPLTSALGAFPVGIAFDGSKIWTANNGGSVSIVSLNPIAVTTVSTGFSSPRGMLYDGTNIWVTDNSASALFKLDANSAIVQTVDVGSSPNFPVFDGINIWVPNRLSDSLSVVRVKDAVGNPLASAIVLATLTANGLDFPSTAAFDGERILVTNSSGQVSLWKAADLTPLNFFPTGATTDARGACSDGLNFWIALQNTNKLARF